MSGCEVFGEVENSVLASDVTISKGAIVKNSIIMSDVKIDEGAIVEYSIVDEGTSIGKNAVIGEDKANKKGITVLSRMINIGEGAKIEGGSIIDKDVYKEENL